MSRLSSRLVPVGLWALAGALVLLLLSASPPELLAQMGDTQRSTREIQQWLIPLFRFVLWALAILCFGAAFVEAFKATKGQPTKWLGALGLLIVATIAFEPVWAFETLGMDRFAYEIARMTGREGAGYVPPSGGVNGGLRYDSAGNPIETVGGQQGANAREGLRNDNGQKPGDSPYSSEMTTLIRARFLLFLEDYPIEEARDRTLQWAEAHSRIRNARLSPDRTTLFAVLDNGETIPVSVR